MTLTRFQIHERLGGLAGEMKAARELDRINADTLAAKEHELTLAAQAKEKSEANITRLEDEARSLAAQYASSVEELIGSVAGPAPVPMDAASLEWAQGEAAQIVAADPELQAIDDIDPTFKSGDNGISVTNIFENPVYTNGISRALDAAQNP